MRRIALLVLVAAMFLIQGTVRAQQPSNAQLLKMFNEMKAKLDKTTAELAAVKKKLAARDKQFARVEDIGPKLDLVEKSAGMQKKVDAFIAENEQWIRDQKRKDEFGLLFGAQTGLYHQPSSFLVGGFYDFGIVPRDSFGNKLAGEIMVTWSRSDSDYTFTPALGPVVDTLLTQDPVAGPSGVNPFRQTFDNKVDIDTLSIIVGAKYKIQTLGRLKPYMAGGLGFYVIGMDPHNNYVVGQIQPAPELLSRGYPAGNADLEVGVNLGGGLQYDITELLSIGFDSRMNWNTGGHDTDFATFAGFFSFNF